MGVGEGEGGSRGKGTFWRHREQGDFREVPVCVISGKSQHVSAPGCPWRAVTPWVTR